MNEKILRLALGSTFMVYSVADPRGVEDILRNTALFVIIFSLRCRVHFPVARADA